MSKHSPIDEYKAKLKLLRAKIASIEEEYQAKIVSIDED